MPAQGWAADSDLFLYDTIALIVCILIQILELLSREAKYYISSAPP